MSEGSPTSDPLITARRRYLIAELSQLGITLEEPVHQLLLDELLVALYPEVHEGKIASYGAILTRETSFDNYRDERLFGAVKQFDFGNPVINRAAADGLSTFLWRATDSSKNVERVISFESARIWDELLAFSLRDDAMNHRYRWLPVPQWPDDFLLIQRVERLIRVMTKRGVIYIRDNVWQFHPYQYDFPIDDLVEQLWPGEPDLAAIARSIGRLAVHLLSPNGVGATFVLFGRSNRGLEALAYGSAVDLGCGDRSPPLSLLARDCHRAIASIVSQRDGAVVVDVDGRVTHANVWLNLPADADDGSLGGARQRSAKEASREIEGIVITVSADGPVRAFNGGKVRRSTVPGEEELE